MSLVIYQLEYSPYCIPITAALDALGVPYETVEVPSHDRTAVIQASGGQYYQVPFLVDEGRPVIESGPGTIDIARYIDTVYGEGHLFPPAAEGVQRIVIPYLENEVESVTFKLLDPQLLDAIDDVVARTMTIRHKERRFGRGCVDEWRKAAPELLDQTGKLLEPFELMLRHAPFVLGDRPVYADYALLGIIGNLTYRGYHQIPGSLANIRQWHARIAAFRFPC